MKTFNELHQDIMKKLNVIGDRATEHSNMMGAGAKVEDSVGVKAAELIDDLTVNIDMAAHIAQQYGGIDGPHHKDWVIDQMVRALMKDRYDEFVQNAKEDEDGVEQWDWDVGTPP